MSASQFKIEWLDRGREPQCPPNPNHPNGVDIPAVLPGPHCKAELPYPAKRCGVYVVQCGVCGYTIAVTTAGRPDDPRSIMVPCRKAAGNA